MLINKDTININYINLYSLQNEEIVIPIFQRFYSWKPDQVNQLKEDLSNLINDQSKQLYLFDFIYYEEDGKIKLADGQQRLVTINNLIKAINDVVKEKGIEIKKLNLFNINYDTLSNNDLYKKHFCEDSLRTPFKTIYFLMKNFVEENIEKIDVLIDVLKNNIFVYMKKCDGVSDAFEIFQQVNTGGKPLTKDEIVNTVLTQNAKMYDIEYNVPKKKEIMKQIVSYYRFKVDETKTLDLGEIMNFLKQHVVKDKKSLEEFIKITHALDKIKDNPIMSIISYINRKTITDVVHILEIKNIFNKDYLNHVVIPMCMMSIVLTLNNGSPTTFSYLLKEVIDRVKRQEEYDKIEHYLHCEVEENDVWKIHFNVFKDKIGDKNTPTNLKKALLIIDVIIGNTSGEICLDRINLEHIYPQNPDSKWAEKGWPASTVDGRQKSLINNIGNFFLLNEKVNKKIQNYYIDDKKNEYNKIIEKDHFLQTELNKVDFDCFEVERDKYICERQEKIANYIYEKFPLGNKLIIKY